MAVATGNSNARMAKAVVALPLVLALLVVAAAGASGAEDGPGAVAESGGRFTETPVGRKLLNISLCGPGPAPTFSCKVYLPLAYNATCCTDLLGTSSCFDVGAYDLFKCGSCNTTCKVGEVCCRGVCANLLTDRNNCGICGKKCTGVTGCKLGLCGY